MIKNTLLALLLATSTAFGAAKVNTADIADNAVTNTKLAQMAHGTFKCRTSASTGTAEDCSGTQATALLDTFSSSLPGLVPASGGSSTSLFLTQAGTFASAGTSSPLTTKGDLYGFSTVNARLPVGTDTYVLTADSTATLGVKWSAAAATGVTSVAQTVPSWLTVSGSPITTSGTLAITATTGQTANQFLATPNGSTGAVGLRAIVGDDLPNPTSTKKGGIISDACLSHQFVNSTTTGGDITCAQPSFSDISSTASNSQLANMAQSTIKGRAAGAGTGVPVDLTATQATAILDAFVGDSGSGGTKGVVPAPASGDAAARRRIGADGNWKNEESGAYSGKNLVALDTAANSWANSKPNNYDAETAVGDWAAYADAAAAIPVDMTGGSPNTTCARNTSSPIDGTADFLMTLTTGASRQGEGCSLLVNIPTAYRGKAIRLTFPYSTTGTLAAGDIVPYAYDVTNSSLLAPSATVSGITGTAGTLYSIFQTQTSTAQLRIGLHIARTSTAVATVEFDDVKLDPDFAQANVPMSDLTAFTPVTSFSTNATNTGFYRRDGDMIEVWENIAFSGATNSTVLTMNLPSACSAIDTSKLPFATTDLGTLGEIKGSVPGSSNYYFGVVAYNNTTSVKAQGLVASSASNHTWQEWSEATSTPVGIGVSGRSIQAHYKVPCSGWSSGGGTSPILSLSDWKAYTLTIGATSVAPTPGTSSSSAWYRRVGDSMEIIYNFKQTGAGSAGTGTYLFPIPAGFTIDTTKVDSTFSGIGATGSIVGSGLATSTNSSATSTANSASIHVASTTALAISRDTGTAGQRSLVDSSNFQLSSTTINYSFYAKVPISGWTSTSSGTLTAPRTEITVSTGNGFGSTNTKIRRYTTTEFSQGDITYADSSTLGGSFTIGSAGVYTITVSDFLSGSNTQLGFSVNSSALTTNVGSLTYAQGFRGYTVAVNSVNTFSRTVNLNAGDVVRSHGDGAATSVSAQTSFITIEKVSN